MRGCWSYRINVTRFIVPRWQYRMFYFARLASAAFSPQIFESLTGVEPSFLESFLLIAVWALAATCASGFPVPEDEVDWGML